MKWLFKSIVLMLFLGVTLVVIGLFMGIDMNGLQNYLSENESFSDQIEYITDSEILELNFDLDSRDIILYLTDDPNIRILYFEKESDTWTITEDDGVFFVKQEEKPRAWFLFRIPTRTYRQMKVYIPKEITLDLKIVTKTGSIQFETDEVQNYGVVHLESNTGNIITTRMNASRFTAKTDTGSVNVAILNVEQAVSISSSTGTVDARFIIADKITMKTSTGDARLENSQITNQAKISVSTGSIHVKLSTAASFDLTSSTGDVSFKIVNGVTYQYDLSVSTGTVRVFGESQGKKHKTSVGDVPIYGKTSTGNIYIIS
jgi:DUF4097 and DUF4098 domain-containing protein YvlB